VISFQDQNEGVLYTMPKRLVALPTGAFAIIDSVLSPLEERSVRVSVEFGAPKHGTEQHLLQGGFSGKRWDPELRLFLPNLEGTAAPPSQRGIGNMVVGTVLETGAQAPRFQAGDKVFGYGSLSEIVQAPEENWIPLGDLNPEDAVCADPAHVAFVGIRDGNVRIGDDVVVFGLGAIGLLTVQIARAAGARRVFAVDPVTARRRFAEANGADATFDPMSDDIALAIKRATGGAGVDVSLETSGNARALQEAARCIRQCGTIVHMPWGPTTTTGLHFDEEWHVNRPRMVFSQAAPYWGNPDRDYPLWDAARALEGAIELFRRGKITGKGIITPVIDFAKAPDLLPELMSNPERSIKAGVKFPPAQDYPA
jgi:threonine dehydrogenase-like Zn-dependent dehydrogenase